MRQFGGGMTCVDEIRGEERGPVPVADAHEQAYKSGPQIRRPHQFCSPAQRGCIGLNTPGCGAGPTVFARGARGFFYLVYPIEINRNTQLKRALDMDDALLNAIQKSSVEETSCAAALLVGRAALYLYNEAEKRKTEALSRGGYSASDEIWARDYWDAARILIAIRELVREIGRHYTAGAVIRGEF